MDIPDQWEDIDLTGLHGLLMVIGAPDVGKSTFSQYLYKRLQGDSRKIAFLDGDPGQSRLGPPTTMTLAIHQGTGESLSGKEEIWRVFVGSVSPSRHMLPMLVRAAKLLGAAKGSGAETIVYDTTGLIDKDQGGLHFKQAKIELLNPSVILALQRGKELEPILTPFRRSGRVNIIDVKPSLATVERSPYMRRRYRRLRFTKYFENSHTITLDWSKVAVFPRPFFTKYGLVALEDKRGFALALGIAVDIQPHQRNVTLMIPEGRLGEVAALRVGDIMVDPASFEDQRI
ncbi:MAG: hypothetical protein JRH08_07615 [Deltaproteobacteria bacterium]|nr:hypothetical protein [Deltaproteobacteria bacterium]MBW1930773.1 hypothetical protein [Deltaproteobacteria bacterium]MBW2024743.1 hypothetical protein [Deltaproteobacteria bacterium]MBW2125554.1 hypothetical protein [Deltaproteobacteria bacterium]RLB22548.1 MAG: hypothetical protein DRG76_06430 [Deltaproteobacteria bacterium]